MVTIGLYGIRDTTNGTQPTYVHDHGLAVMRDGQVQTVVPLERWTRRKNDNRLCDLLPSLLDDLHLGDEAVRFVSVNSFVGDSFQTTDGNLRIEPAGTVRIQSMLQPARVRWFPDGLRPREATAEVLCHEFAHVASLLPFVGRFEPNSLLVHIDGGASDSASSFWYWDGSSANLLESSWDQLKIPVNNFNGSPLVRAILGFQSHEHLSIPGKLMGYAGHGESNPQLLAFLEEHAFFLNGPEQPTELLAIVNRRFGTNWSRFDAQEPLCRDLCATIQTHFENTICSAILGWQKRTNAEHLYYAGGAALNIPTNARLERSGAFRSVHVPPCTNDTGLALGAAAWREFQDRGELPVHSPFLCKQQGPGIEVSLHELERIADWIAAGEVIGICNGDAEIGPRALGHRSILARPDSIELRRRVSEEIKRREWYRPVAPVLTLEVAMQAFGGYLEHSRLASFMLGAYSLLPAWRSHFAGVIHADGSLRPQIVRSDEPEGQFMYALLTCLWARHGLAGLINTSFNGPGEPIVQSPADALDCGRRLGLDGVVVNGSIHRP